ncbi:hypothetical protein RHGRI_035124 [Rhododendron griersonianum]|uniref:Uncharacterized protein n=1 Tax=Rhododendron griersonianum TaxID=479676 RepID=A0AAV6I3S5_9ERIC|nr:hypothetical protein RHGRI_035124 [Rhododendron griersonianum]
MVVTTEGYCIFHDTLQVPPVLSSCFSNKDGSPGMEYLRTFALLGAGVSGLLSFTTIASADEAEHGLPCPNYPWPHQGILNSYDHGSMLNMFDFTGQNSSWSSGLPASLCLISYRDLVGVAYTEEETKAMAAEIEPYANEQAARFANGGAYPPDLSLITKARHNGQNYLFALLIGYRDPRAGVSLLELEKNPDKHMQVLPLLEDLGERDDLSLNQPGCTAVMKVCIRLGQFEIVERLFN